MIVPVVLALVVGGIVVFGLTATSGREGEIVRRRLETARAFYAAEAGVNMARRELRLNRDEDGDGGVGSVSDDGDPENDPAVGMARVCVAIEAGTSGVVLSSRGRCGSSRREIEVELKG